MSLLERQWEFAQSLAEWLPFATDYCKKNNLTLSLRQLQRTPMEAWANSLPGGCILTAKAPNGKEFEWHDKVGGVGISNSLHISSLAIDAMLFKDGKPVEDEATYLPLGEKW